MATQKIIELTTGDLVQAFYQNEDEPATSTTDPTFAFKSLPDDTEAKVIVFVNELGEILTLK